MEKSLQKMVLIGPVYPYKGGIAHYTGLLARCLREEYDVHVISYSFQYPKLLYKKPQKDTGSNTLALEDVQYLLHTANPFNWGKVARRINEIGPDLVVVQWWHPYFAPCYHALLKRLKHTKVLFTCHNVFPHERFPFDHRLTKAVLAKGDYFVVHSGLDEADLYSIKPGAVAAAAVHPAFNHFRVAGLTAQQARQKLGIAPDENVLLFFGFVRKYKGLHTLLDALPQILARLQNTRLLVVGDFGGDKEDYTGKIARLGVAANVDIYDGYIPDGEVAQYFLASDLAVLPYESATQSGIVQIAYDFGKPVVATDVGGLPEVVQNGKTGYVVPPQNPAMLADAVVRFFDENRAEEFTANVKAEAHKYEWARMRETIDRLFQTGAGRVANGDETGVKW